MKWWRLIRVTTVAGICSWQLLEKVLGELLGYYDSTPKSTLQPFFMHQPHLHQTHFKYTKMFAISAGHIERNLYFVCTTAHDVLLAKKKKDVAWGEAGAHQINSHV